MVKTTIERLNHLHTTFGLIYEAHAAKMTTAEQELFATALEELFDVIDQGTANETPPGSEWPESLAEKWRSMR
jgi:hypothetical protein